MKKKMITEEDVKGKLRIVDFNSITKDKMAQFVTLLPKLDKELAIKIIEQFPNYANLATSMVTNLIDLCNNALNNSKITEKEAICAYKSVLETIKSELETEKITPHEREIMTDKMIEVADKISALDERNKKWLGSITKYSSSAVCVTLVVGAAILGINSINNNKEDL